MKEATGELSGTVITVVAIAAVAAIFTIVILPIIRRSIALTTACSAAGDGNYNQTLKNSDTITCTASGGNTTCVYKVNGTTETNSKTCKVDTAETA